MQLCRECAGVAPLCDTCVDQRLAWHLGYARAAGQRWGAAVRETRPGQPWPTWEASPRLRQLARAKVADIADDERLRDALARACADAACASYTTRAPRPGSVAFYANGRARPGSTSNG